MENKARTKLVAPLFQLPFVELEGTTLMSGGELSPPIPLSYRPHVLHFQYARQAVSSGAMVAQLFWVKCLSAEFGVYSLKSQESQKVQ